MFREGFWKAVLPLLVGPLRSRIVHCSQLLPSCQSPANSWQTAQVPFNFNQTSGPEQGRSATGHRADSLAAEDEHRQTVSHQLQANVSGRC